MRWAALALMCAAGCGLDTYRPPVMQEIDRSNVGGDGDGGGDDEPQRPPLAYHQLAVARFDTTGSAVAAIPDANVVLPALTEGAWLLLMSARVGSDSTSQNGAALAIDVDGTRVHLSTAQNTTAYASGSAQMVYCIPAGSAEHAVAASLSSPNNAHARVEDFSLVAVAMPASADVHCTSQASKSASPNVYTQIASLNITPSSDGEYLVFVSAVAQETPGTDSVEMRVRNPDGSSWGAYANGRGALQSFFVARAQTLTVPVDVAVEASGSDGPGSNITYANIVAVRSDAFAERLLEQTIGDTHVAAGATVTITGLHADARTAAGKRLVVQTLEPTIACSDPTLLLEPTLRRTENIISAFSYAVPCGTITSYGAVSLADATTSLDLENNLTAPTDSSTTRATDSVIIVLGL